MELPEKTVGRYRVRLLMSRHDPTACFSLQTGVFWPFRMGSVDSILNSYLEPEPHRF
jgi:hypothetical protein